MKCGAVTKSGRACQANALRNSQFCLLHGDSERARVLGARGGRNRAHIVPDLKRLPPPLTPNAIRDQVAQWAIFRDTEVADRYLEIFLVNSWAENLRQHERLTQADRELEGRIGSYLSAEPKVRHLIDAGVAET